MNATVDLNEMRVLLLLILLTAEICYEVKDMHRAFFFYNQGVKNYWIFRELLPLIQIYYMLNWNV
jgi:hypothetical protein